MVTSYKDFEDRIFEKVKSILRWELKSDDIILKERDIKKHLIKKLCVKIWHTLRYFRIFAFAEQ